MNPNPSSSIPVRLAIVAAGRGTRFGGAIPKQFECLAGRMVFIHALERLASLEAVEEAVVVGPPVGPPEDAREALEAWLRKRAANGPSGKPFRARWVPGGERRQDSVAAGLAALAAPDGVVFIHDAARPFPPPAACARLTNAAMEAGAGLLALPVVDTVKRGNADGRTAGTVDRRFLWLAQTPQAVRADWIAPLIDKLRGPEEFTDEAAAMESLGAAPALVEGSWMNFKITQPGDLERAEAMLRAERAG